MNFLSRVHSFWIPWFDLMTQITPSNIMIVHIYEPSCENIGAAMDDILPLFSFQIISGKYYFKINAFKICTVFSRKLTACDLIQYKSKFWETVFQMIDNCGFLPHFPLPSLEVEDEPGCATGLQVPSLYLCHTNSGISKGIPNPSLLLRIKV